MKHIPSGPEGTRGDSRVQVTPVWARRFLCALILPRFLMNLLREIGDQNAYARHLAAHGAAHSGAEWRRFSDERLRAKYRKAKCC